MIKFLYLVEETIIIILWGNWRMKQLITLWLVVEGISFGKKDSCYFAVINPLALEIDI